MADGHGCGGEREPVTAPHTMIARRARIVELLARHRISSQDELGRLLGDEGISVTQATLSRDLDAVGAHKQADESGVRYVVDPDVAAALAHGGEASEAALARTVEELLLDADSAGNIAVLRTPPGAAQYLAGQVDRSGRFDTVGSVAGDDTIILVMRTPKAAQEMCREMLGLAEARRTT